MTAPDGVMGDEFDTMATWTLEALEALDALGPGHRLPGACRGSGRPAALDWLLDRLDVPAGGALLDVGAGLGGPAAYARDRDGARPVCVDPVRSACRAATRLFGLRAVVADASRLPIADRSFDAAWSLGTLCTTDEKERWLGELSRVVRAGGRLGLLVLVAAGEAFRAPWGNAFPSDGDLHRLLGAAGFRVVDRAWSADLREPGAAWHCAEEEVGRMIDAVHGDDPRLALIRDQEQRLGRLLASGRVRGRLVVARAQPAQHVGGRSSLAPALR